MTISVQTQCEIASSTFKGMERISSDVKSRLLHRMADNLISHSKNILAANQIDIRNGKANGLSAALLDRLSLSEARISDISSSIRSIADLPDPIGDILSDWTVPSGLHIQKVRVPIGVIGMIYEARPNVTADAIALTFKTGNGVVLRGSSSAYQSNLAITSVLKSCIEDDGIDPSFIQLLEDTSRESVTTFVRMNDYIHLIIPRGGAGLIQSVCQSATVPTIETGVGNCHIYVDSAVDIKKAISIIVNSKIDRPSVCNSLESLLLHADIAAAILPDLVALLREHSVLVKGDDRVRKIVSDIEVAATSDWDTEFLDLTLPIKIVDTLDEAIDHIRIHGTQHTDVILSTNATAQKRFCDEVDAASVGVNVSTRFTDGGQFGFGAELGISTQMLHARGPMGLPELCSYKYVMSGDHLLR